MLCSHDAQRSGTCAGSAITPASREVGAGPSGVWEAGPADVELRLYLHNARLGLPRSELCFPLREGQLEHTWIF